jgi:uncharacterized protein (DUF2126 family)
MYSMPISPLRTRLRTGSSEMRRPTTRLTCNGGNLPLHPTGVEGEYRAGLRCHAWQPPSCLHPTIPVDAPLLFDLND